MENVYEYKLTTRKCLEGKRVYAAYLLGQFVGYRYKTHKATIKKIQKTFRLLGVPKWNEATVLNGWFYHKENNIYTWYEDGKAMKKSNHIEGYPESYLN